MGDVSPVIRITAQTDAQFEGALQLVDAGLFLDQADQLLRIDAVLGAAGFLDVRCRAFDAQVGAGDVDASLELALHVGPVGAALREHPEARDGARRALEIFYRQHAGAQGVQLKAGVWIVTART